MIYYLEDGRAVWLPNGKHSQDAITEDFKTFVRRKESSAFISRYREKIVEILSPYQRGDDLNGRHSAGIVSVVRFSEILKDLNSYQAWEALRHFAHPEIYVFTTMPTVELKYAPMAVPSKY